MKKFMFRVLGIVYLLLGVFLIFGSSSGITGFAVADQFQQKAGSVLGIVSIIIAIVLWSSRFDYE